MNNAIDGRTYQCKALTDLWTGNADREGNRLIATGLLGSIRWWFEVLVRGLGGGACDPSKKLCRNDCHCAVCELFGRTGWARKFRFHVLDDADNIQSEQIKKNKTFKLRFIPLRPIKTEEWALLDATLRLISEYGAIGGRTVFKPTDEARRENMPHHKGYGLIQITFPQYKIAGRSELESYFLKSEKCNHHNFAWASLQNFWCVQGKYLARQTSEKSTFNQIIQRPEPKRQSAKADSWLAGSQGESKKVFSFKNPARTFGFINPDKRIDFDTMKQRLVRAWGQGSWKVLVGGQVIDQLFDGKGERS